MGFRTKILFIVILFQVSLINIGFSQFIIPKELFVDVFSDGYLLVKYGLEIDETRPSVNITIPSSQYEYLIVEDENSIPLSYTETDKTLNVDTLGSSYVYIEYETQEHTSKDGLRWNITLDVPYICNIYFPDNTVILSFSPAPLAMSQHSDKILIVMPPGIIELGYMFSAMDERENTLDSIKRAEYIINDIKDQGILVGEAEDLLQQANDAFDKNEYEKASNLSSNATLIAEQIKIVALNAIEEIQAAKIEINDARSSQRTSGLEQAETQLSKAEELYSQGKYEESISFALAARTFAEEAEIESQENSMLLYLLVGLLTIGIIGAYYILRIRKTQSYKIDIEAIFRENPYLREEEKEVINFIAEKGGELFASQLNEKFEIPRTSQWRMLNRLKSYEIISIKSIGRQNLVLINKKYLSGNGTK